MSGSDGREAQPARPSEPPSAQTATPQSEAVAWQVRWTNPGNNPDAHDEKLLWGPVEPFRHVDQTMEQKVAELRAYRYNGKPCYEVRALYAAPPSSDGREPKD